VALGKLAEMRASLAASLRGALLLAVPASVGLMLLRTPVVALLYERGEFDEFSTQLVSWALLWYSAGLVGHALVEILSRAFYALHDTRTPVLVGALAMGMNVGLSYLFSAIFLRVGWMAHGGLALANSAATAVEAVILLGLMRRRLQGLEGGRLLNGAAQAGLAALAMAAGVWGWVRLTAGQPDWLAALGGIAVGAASYAACILALGVGEARGMVTALRRRLAR
jgi:putative peptidoglycan lipid II flippase